MQSKEGLTICLVDIKNQILDQVKDSPVLAIQCDEMTDIAQCSQLLAHARFVPSNCAKKRYVVLSTYGQLYNSSSYFS